MTVWMKKLTIIMPPSGPKDSRPPMTTERTEFSMSGAEDVREPTKWVMPWSASAANPW